MNLFSLKQYAARTGIPRPTLSRWIKAGMPVQRPRPTLVRVNVDAADAWIRAHRRRVRPQNGLIYAMRAADGAIKLGYTIDVERRASEHGRAGHGAVVVLASAPGTMTEEQSLHRRLAQHRIEGEWYRPSAEVLEVVGWLRSR